MKSDVPLLHGYKYEFMPVIRPMKDLNLTQHINRGIFRALRRGKFDAVCVHGYWNLNCWMVIVVAKILGIPVIDSTERAAVQSRLDEAGARRTFVSWVSGTRRKCHGSSIFATFWFCRQFMCRSVLLLTR